MFKVQHADIRPNASPSKDHSSYSCTYRCNNLKSKTNETCELYIFTYQHLQTTAKSNSKNKLQRNPQEITFYI